MVSFLHDGGDVGLGEHEAVFQLVADELGQTVFEVEVVERPNDLIDLLFIAENGVGQEEADGEVREADGGGEGWHEGSFGKGPVNLKPPISVFPEW
jgi:hypothetical protein